MRQVLSILPKHAQCPALGEFGRHSWGDVSAGIHPHACERMEAEVAEEHGSHSAGRRVTTIASEIRPHDETRGRMGTATCGRTLLFFLRPAAVQSWIAVASAYECAVATSNECDIRVSRIRSRVSAEQEVNRPRHWMSASRNTMLLRWRPAARRSSRRPRESAVIRGGAPVIELPQAPARAGGIDSGEMFGLPAHAAEKL